LVRETRAAVSEDVACDADGVFGSGSLLRQMAVAASGRSRASAARFMVHVEMRSGSMTVSPDDRSV
jgi:hypothetical protein